MSSGRATKLATIPGGEECRGRDEDGLGPPQPPGRVTGVVGFRCQDDAEVDEPEADGDDDPGPAAAQDAERERGDEHADRDDVEPPGWLVSVSVAAVSAGDSRASRSARTPQTTTATARTTARSVAIRIAGRLDVRPQVRP